MTTIKPYKQGPEELGMFATRSPLRPNPIALSTIQVISLDEQTGVIEVGYIDADNDTPLLDIKPYLPCEDIVCNVETPSWCAHWPSSTEASATYDWEKEINF